MVALNFSITEQDLFYFYDYNARHQEGLGKNIFICIVALLSFFLAFYEKILHGEMNFILIRFFICILFMFFGLTGHLAIFFLKKNRNLDQMIEKGKNQTIIFDDKDMKYILNDGSKSLMPYTSIKKIITTKHAIYVFTSDFHANIIPITAFNNNSDLEFVKSKFSSNIK